uniref:ATP synthase subunit a n=1 Tax=Cylisticus convexus TaxID=96835 RepID=A0A0G2T6A5_9CRUS|nr:ATP synthase F0 subunit 6 [Cylisticus convexus]
MAMMTNLFSVFDPASSLGASLNWISMSLGILILPSMKWSINSRWLGLIVLIFKKMYQEVKPIMSKEGKITSIIFMALFLFILFNNILGLVPYVFTATSHFMITFSLALPLWLGYFSFGWVKDFKWMMAHLMPQGTPTVLMPFMVLIESVSSLIRPGTLAVRLMANMIAGHLLLTLVSSAIQVFSIYSVMGVVLAQVMLVVLEVAVAAIQSYVLVVLSVLYSSEV